MPKAKPSRRSIEERNKLVEQFIHLPAWVVTKHSSHSVVRQLGFEDAVQQGHIGLIRAAELYNPKHESKAKFITYASWSIWRWILNKGSMVGGNGVIYVPYGSRYPKKAKEAANCKEISVLYPYADKNGVPIYDKYDHEAACDQADEVMSATRLLQLLPRQQATVMHQRYVEGMRPNDIAEFHGVSKQRISQIVKNAKERLREIRKQE